MRITHDEYFIEITHAVAKRSACLHRQVGCVLVDADNHIIATGYNGPPAGAPHCEVCHRPEAGRDLYACNAVHAEMNALLQCNDVQRIEKAYISINPCQICTRLLLNTGCRTIIYEGVYTVESHKQFLRTWTLGNHRTAIWLTSGTREEWGGG